MPFSREAAARAVNFFERVLVHTKGEWAGQPFVLRDWQRRDIIEPLFGTLNADGTRQYRTAYIELPRKNGKSELAAGIATYLLFADGEEGAEIYGAAGDRDQASIVFRVAAEMVRRSPHLSRIGKPIDSRKRIVVPSTGSFYEAIPADEATAHGFNGSGVIFDELHTQPNRGLWDVLTTSTGARRQPLVAAITTAGYDRHSICWEQHDYAQKVLKGLIKDPTYFAYIRSAADDADWRDERVWRAANPALGDFRSMDEMRAFAHRAENVPALQNTFRRLYLNQWTRQDTRWMDLAKWDACDAPVDAEALRGEACFAGLDLASTTDIAALLLVFPDGGDPPGYDVLPHFWIPEETMRERSRRDRVPYEQWVAEGLITATPGNSIDYRRIRRDLFELASTYRILNLGFDPWNATQFVQDAMDEGMSCLPVRQGFASLNEPTKFLMSLVLDRRIRHAGNAVLRWMADNLTVSVDPAGNLKPDKAKSTEKIDGLVALIIALFCAMRHQDVADEWTAADGLVVLGRR